MRVISEENELALPSIVKKAVKGKVAGSGFHKKSNMSTKSRFLKKFSPKRNIVVVSDNDSVHSETKLQHNHTSQLNN